MKYAEVAVDAAVGHSRTFSYSVPPSLDVLPGQTVMVPFGPRKLQGVVFSLPSAPQVPETREILSSSEAGPVLSDAQLRLARWVSSYYMSSLFEAASLMLPPGGRVRLRSYLMLAPAKDGAGQPSLTEYREKVLAFVRRHKRVAEDRVVEAMGRRAGTAITRLVDGGILVRTQARAGASIGRRIRRYVRLASSADGVPPGRADDLARRAPRQAALLGRLQMDGTPMLVSEARRDYGDSAVRGLRDKGWLEVEAIAEDRDPLAGFSFPPSPAVELTAAQQEASAEVKEALAETSDMPRNFLLEGVTGSGKTEVYLDAVRECLQIGKRAVVLVPEIALTHQTIERFAARFPGDIAVLHSRLTPGQRFDQWWKVRAGEYGVVIGSRSAVFAPQPDLGLIVVDEEHEWAYKQPEPSPRYHARDVALRLADLGDSVVLMGSATPDVESYRRAARGEFRLLRLPGRVVANGGVMAKAESGTAPLASVQVVDMRRELREGHRLMFSRALLGALAGSLKSGAQAVLFLNRRGSASFMQCRSCGLTMVCRRCDISLTYHREAKRLICHHCGDRRVPPDACPRCQGYRMAYYGVGTQAVAEEVTRRFPGARVLRWDRDTASRPEEYESLLQRFRSGEAQVLVGTQMIAKGLHFPAVTVVGVVSADVGLNVPDYRGGERAFQLLCQVAGRAGRGPGGGTVVLQTYQPDSYAIKAAATQDYPRFYEQEIAHRREQGNPPFGRLIRLLYTHTNRAVCERDALSLSDALRRERDAGGYSDIEILGPTPAYPTRVRGHYRWQLVLRGAQPRTLLDRLPSPSGWVVDVDPVGLG